MLIHYYIPLYNITKELIPDLGSRKILDFGCNCGIFLETAEESFPHENYTGIDICEDAIDIARKNFPSANFIYYDGSNPEYNPGGKESLPTLEDKFDLILVSSVFTHTSKEEMLRIIDWMIDHLSESGQILISWTGYDPSFDRFPYGPVRDQILRFFPEHKSMDYCYVVNYSDNGKNKTTITQSFPTYPVLGLWTFYNVEYFQKLLESYDTKFILSRDWKQDMVIISRS